jgi:hypothetical protein
MAFSYGFFNAKNLDRVYTAEDFNSYLSGMICNGIFDTYGSNFSIKPGLEISVIIGTGKAWINGHYFINDTAYTLDLSSYVDESLSRFVTIGISCDVSDSVRACKLEVKSGTAATNPTAPILEDTSTKTFLTLATVKLLGGKTNPIVDTQITDLRDSNRCGYVKCILGKCKVSEILSKLTSYNNTVTELNEKITALQNRLTEVEEVTGTTGVVLVSAGQCGENVFYAIYSDGTVKLNGSGAMYDYESTNRSPFYGDNTLKSLVVSSGITSIGGDAFEDAVNLTKASLPDSITAINSGAFMYSNSSTGVVKGLTSVTIPKNVKTLGNGVFWGSAIESLTIPASVTEIGKYLCRYCIHLKTVRVESSLVGEYMFTNCSALRSLTITINVEKIGTCALTYCSSLTEITYTGTLAQWSSISKGNNWDGKSGMDISVPPLNKIICTDGYLEYDSEEKEWNEVKS